MAVLRFPAGGCVGKVTIGRVSGTVVEALGDVEYEPGTWITLKLTKSDHLHSLRDLPTDAFKTVVFADADMNDDDLKDASFLAGLERLVLEGSAVSDEGLTHLGKITGLRRLFLGGCRITDRGMGSIAGIKNLERLDLTDTQVTDEGVRALRDLKQLEAVMLEGTKVTDEVIDALEPLSALKMVTFQRTAVTPQAVTRIAPHPHLNIWFDDDAPAEAIAELQEKRPELVVNGVRHWSPGS